MKLTVGNYIYDGEHFIMYIIVNLLMLYTWNQNIMYQLYFK